MIHLGRNGDSPTQDVDLTASTQEVIRVWTAGTVDLYSASQIRYVRGPDDAIEDASEVLPSAYDLIPGGAGQRVEVSRKDLARAMRRDGVHYVDLAVWDLSGATVRVTFSGS